MVRSNRVLLGVLLRFQGFLMGMRMEEEALAL